MKKCPFCAEEIQDEAVVCRYCGQNLRVSIPDEPFQSKKPRNTFSKVLIVVFILIAGLFLIRYLLRQHYLNANLVQVRSDFVTQLFMVDRPLSRDTVTNDFEYVGVVKVGTQCTVIDAIYLNSELLYKLNCKGLIGWLPGDAVAILR